MRNLSPEDRQLLYVHEMMHMVYNRAFLSMLAAAGSSDVFSEKLTGKNTQLTLQCMSTALIIGGNIGATYEPYIDIASILYADRAGWDIEKYAALYQKVPGKSHYRLLVIGLTIAQLQKEKSRNENHNLESDPEIFRATLKYMGETLRQESGKMISHLSLEERKIVAQELNESINAMNSEIIIKRFFSLLEQQIKQCEKREPS